MRLVAGELSGPDADRVFDYVERFAAVRAAYPKLSHRY